MVRKIIPLLAVASALVPVAGQAGDPYVGASVGVSRIEGYDGNASTLTARGGYRFSKWMAVEASYSDLGEATWQSCRMDICVPEGQYSRRLSARRTELAAIGAVPLGSHITLFGTAGMGRVSYGVRTRGQLEVDSPFMDETASGRDTTAFFGAGVDFRVASSWSMRFQWDRQNLDTGVFSTFLAGVNFSLGRRP